MPTTVSRVRKTIWYSRYKNLAETIRNKPTGDILRVIHRFLDGNDKYGSMTIAASAKESVEQVIKDLEL